MKFFVCPKCWGIVQMRLFWRYCLCGQTRGKYLDILHARVEGPTGAQAIGMNNDQFERMMQINMNTHLDVPLQTWLYRGGTLNIVIVAKKVRPQRNKCGRAVFEKSKRLYRIEAARYLKAQQKEISQ